MTTVSTTTPAAVSEECFWSGCKAVATQITGQLTPRLRLLQALVDVRKQLLEAKHDGEFKRQLCDFYQVLCRELRSQT